MDNETAKTGIKIFGSAVVAFSWLCWLGCTPNQFGFYAVLWAIIAVLLSTLMVKIFKIK